MWAGNRHVMKMALGTAKIYGYTNIYQCGLIMYSLMQLKMGHVAPLQQGYYPPPPPPIAGLCQPPVPFSQDLLNAVYEYLSSRPSQRPTTDEGQVMVEDGIEDHASDMYTYKGEFGDLPGRDRHYPGKLMYDADQEGLAFRPEIEED